MRAQATLSIALAAAWVVGSLWISGCERREAEALRRDEPRFRAALREAPDDVAQTSRSDEPVLTATVADPAEHRHRGPRRADLRRSRRTERGAEPVARRFFAAFARYELGARDASVSDQLRSTASKRFSAQLLGAPPRSPRTQTPAPPAFGDLTLVPGAVAGSGRLTTIELVGELERAGERSPLAIELVRRRAGWHVAGLGR